MNIEKLLFLDVDGVLNYSNPGPDGRRCNRIRPECCAALARVLEETDAKVVLSSSWRYQITRGQMTVLGFAYMLYTHGLTGMTRALIGHTEEDPEFSDPADLQHDLRSKQVRAWLSANGSAERYVMIDDDEHGAREWGHPIVQTDGRVGFTEADADRVIAVLNGEDDGR
jgi:hypothetical protein